MAQRIDLDPGWEWAKKFNLTLGIKVGNTIYVSGQGPISPEGQIVGKGDVKAQSLQTFENIKAILAEGGATMDDVVKITVFLTDINTYPDFAAARGQAFPNRRPTSTAVATPALVLPDMVVEIEAIAELGSGRR